MLYIPRKLLQATEIRDLRQPDAPVILRVQVKQIRGSQVILGFDADKRCFAIDRSELTLIGFGTVVAVDNAETSDGGAGPRNGQTGETCPNCGRGSG